MYSKANTNNPFADKKLYSFALVHLYLEIFIFKCNFFLGINKLR